MAPLLARPRRLFRAERDGGRGDFRIGSGSHRRRDCYGDLSAPMNLPSFQNPSSTLPFG